MESLAWICMTPAHGKSGGGERGQKEHLGTLYIISGGRERNRACENNQRVGRPECIYFNPVVREGLSAACVPRRGLPGLPYPGASSFRSEALILVI